MSCDLQQIKERLRSLFDISVFFLKHPPVVPNPPDIPHTPWDIFWEVLFSEYIQLRMKGIMLPWRCASPWLICVLWLIEGKCHWCRIVSQQLHLLPTHTQSLIDEMKSFLSSAFGLGVSRGCWSINGIVMFVSVGRVQSCRACFKDFHFRAAGFGFNSAGRSWDLSSRCCQRTVKALKLCGLVKLDHGCTSSNRRPASVSEGNVYITDLLT